MEDNFINTVLHHSSWPQKRQYFVFPCEFQSWVSSQSFKQIDECTSPLDIFQCPHLFFKANVSGVPCAVVLRQPQDCLSTVSARLKLFILSTSEISTSESDFEWLREYLRYVAKAKRGKEIPYPKFETQLAGNLPLKSDVDLHLLLLCTHGDYFLEIALRPYESGRWRSVSYDNAIPKIRELHSETHEKLQAIESHSLTILGSKRKAACILGRSSPQKSSCRFQESHTSNLWTSNDMKELMSTIADKVIEVVAISTQPGRGESRVAFHLRAAVVEERNIQEALARRNLHQAAAYLIVAQKSNDSGRLKETAIDEEYAKVLHGDSTISRLAFGKRLSRCKVTAAIANCDVALLAFINVKQRLMSSDKWVPDVVSRCQERFPTQLHVHRQKIMPILVEMLHNSGLTDAKKRGICLGGWGLLDEEFRVTLEQRFSWLSPVAFTESLTTATQFTQFDDLSLTLTGPEILSSNDATFSCFDNGQWTDTNDLGAMPFLLPSQDPGAWIC